MRTDLLQYAVLATAIFLACIAISSCAVPMPSQEDVDQFVRNEIKKETKAIDDLTTERNLAANSPDRGGLRAGSIYRYDTNEGYVNSIAGAYCRRAKDYEDLHEGQEATDDYNKAIALLETLPVTWKNETLPELYSKRGQYQKAVDYYSKLLSVATPSTIPGSSEVIFPPSTENYPRTVVASIYHARANNYVKLNEDQKAIDDCTEAIKQSDQHINWGASLLRGQLYVRVGQYQGAIADLSNVIDQTEASKSKYARDYAIDPSGPPGMFGRWPKERPDSYYDRYLKPTAAPCYYWRSVAYEKSGKRDLAEQDKTMAKKLGYKPEGIDTH